MNPQPSSILELQMQQKQKSFYAIPIPMTIVPANSVVTSVVIIMPSDSWFRLENITGSFTAPSGEVPNSAMSLQDLGSGNAITEGYIELSNILSPGLVIAGATSPFVRPFMLSRTFEKSAQLRIDFLNRSTTGSIKVSGALWGSKKFV